MNKIKIRIKLFFQFIYECVKYPTIIIENWEDMNTRYYFQTDPEMISIFKEIEELSKQKDE